VSSSTTNTPEPEDRLQWLLEKVRDRERTALRRTIVYSLIPIVVAGLVLGIISWITSGETQQKIKWQALVNQELVPELVSPQQEFVTAQQELVSTRDERDKVKQELVSARDERDKVKQELVSAGMNVTR
jgi:hypothetical protein